MKGKELPPHVHALIGYMIRQLSIYCLAGSRLTCYKLISFRPSVTPLHLHIYEGRGGGLHGGAVGSAEGRG